MSRSFALRASSNYIILALSGTWIDYLDCFLECWFWCSGQRFVLWSRIRGKNWHRGFSFLYLCIFTNSPAVLKFTFATCKAQLAVWVENYSCRPELHLKFSLRSRALIIFVQAQNFSFPTLTAGADHAILNHAERRGKGKYILNVPILSPTCDLVQYWTLIKAWESLRNILSLWSFFGLRAS